MLLVAMHDIPGNAGRGRWSEIFLEDRELYI